MLGKGPNLLDECVARCAHLMKKSPPVYPEGAVKYTYLAAQQVHRRRQLT